MQKAKEEGSALGTAENFSYSAGMGARADCGGVRCLIGNQRLMQESGVDVAAAEADAVRLAEGGKTVLFFACGGRLAALFAVCLLYTSRCV